MDFTPRLALPCIAPQQAQKHITFNEAMRALDTLVQPAVISASTGTPAGAPAEGDAYLVPAGATGAWSGHAGKFARWSDGGWTFLSPADGWLAFVADTAEIRIRFGGAWTPLVSTGGSSLGMLGINASADATNRLAVGADASVFTHNGADHRLKLNKASAAATGSVVFQTGWSGRAEIGLTGDDDLHVKVSADGSVWTEALRVARTTGAVALSSGQLGFPATQIASSSPNTLDDYEEGTTIPAVSAGAGAITGATSTLAYTKIGNVVVWNARIAITDNGTGAGYLRLSLPYANGSQIAAACGTRTDSGTALACQVAAGSSMADIFLYNGTYPGVSGAQIVVGGAYSV